jgi:hypothetical protein
LEKEAFMAKEIKMLPRHESSLITHLEAVTKLGWSHINWWELYLWYDAKRIGKETWRDLQRRFEEDNKGDLHIYESEQGVLLINNDSLTTTAKKLGEDED